MEATKWLKSLVSGSRIGDRASVQAATCVSASNYDPRQNRRKLLIDKLFVRNRSGHDWTPMDSSRNL